MATAWHCRKCRLRLCDEGDLDVHQRMEHGLIRRNPWKTDLSANSCTSLFLSEPLAWMAELNDASGQIKCPNARCGAKLGGWNWSGSQCSCGAWVTPSISLVASRLDRKTVEDSLNVVFETVAEDATGAPAAAAAAAELREVMIVDRSAAFETAVRGASPGSPLPPSAPSAEDLTAAAAVAEASAAAAAAAAAAVALRRGSGRCACSIHWFVTAPPPAVVVFLHDEGEGAAVAKAWVDDKWGGRLMAETRAAFLFPDSGASPRTGRRVWFDTVAAEAAAGGAGSDVGGGGGSSGGAGGVGSGVGGFFSEASPDCDVVGLVAELRALVRAVVRQGTPASRVFLGGVGHGGVAALVAGLRLHTDAGVGGASGGGATRGVADEPPVRLGGVFCFGGALDPSSALFAELAHSAASTPPVGAPAPPPVLLCHGRDDPSVTLGAVTASAARLRELLPRPCDARGDSRGGEANGDEDGGLVQLFTFKGHRADGGVRTLAAWITASGNAGGGV